MSGENMRAKVAVFLLAILITLGFLFVKIQWSDFYLRIVQEDSFLEYGQFFAYGGASVVAVLAGLGSRKRGYLWNGYVFLFLAFVLMMVSMEEISWGQRLFAVTTPEFFEEHSSQKEINVHNLYPVQHVLHLLYVAVGLVFSFGGIPARRLTSVRESKDAVRMTIRLFSPKWYLMFFFLPVAALYSYFIVLSLLRLSIRQAGNFIIARDQEPAELLLALGLLLYVIVCMIQSKHAAGRTHCRPMP